jgi:hypothetical protein
MLARGQVPGNEAVLDRGGGHDVGLGGRGGVHVGDQVGQIRIAGLGQVRLGADPLGRASPVSLVE